MRVSDRKALNKTKGKVFRDLAATRIGSSELDAALEGDYAAVRTLIARTASLAEVALSAYWGGTPTDAYADLLSSAWADDWLFLKSAVEEDLQLLRRMFRAAQFTCDLYGHEYGCDLQGRIEIYRGARGVDAAAAAEGLSWSLSRDVACYFAHQKLKFEVPGEPMVVRAVINPHAMIYVADNSEQEVIVGRRLKALPDPKPASWLSGSERYYRECIAPNRQAIAERLKRLI